MNGELNMGAPVSVEIVDRQVILPKSMQENISDDLCQIMARCTCVGGVETVLEKASDIINGTPDPTEVLQYFSNVEHALCGSDLRGRERNYALGIIRGVITSLEQYITEYGPTSGWVLNEE